jgi:predicted RNase H-like HicB family nuclease
MLAMPKIMNFRVIIEQEEDGVFVASAPAIPGCHTQGATYEDAVENVKEAIELCLEVAKDDRGYRAKIDWSETEDKNRFLGIAKIPVKLGFSL